MLSTAWPHSLDGLASFVACQQQRDIALAGLVRPLTRREPVVLIRHADVSTSIDENLDDINRRLGRPNGVEQRSSTVSRDGIHVGSRANKELDDVWSWGRGRSHQDGEASLVPYVGVGTAADNAAMESFFALLQKNVLDRKRWATRDDLRIAIITWIERTYHQRRRQARLGRLTPIGYEIIMTPQTATAA